MLRDPGGAAIDAFSKSDDGKGVAKIGIAAIDILEQLIFLHDVRRSAAADDGMSWGHLGDALHQLG